MKSGRRGSDGPASRAEGPSRAAPLRTAADRFTQARERWVRRARRSALTHDRDHSRDRWCRTRAMDSGARAEENAPMRRGIDIVRAVTGAPRPARSGRRLVHRPPPTGPEAPLTARVTSHDRPAPLARLRTLAPPPSQPEVDIAHVNPQGHWLDDARPRSPHERPAFRALRATQGGRLESDSPSTRDALGPTCRPRARVRTPTLNRAVAGVSERRHRPAPPTCWRSASLLDKPLQPALPPHQVRPRSRGITPLRAGYVDRASRRCRVLVPIFDTTVDLVNARPFTHPIGHDPVRRRHPSVDAASTAAPAAVGTAVDASR